MEKIVNRVANSKLKTFDLADYYPKNNRITVDLSDFLFQGLILKEKEFRTQLDQWNVDEYQDAFVNIICSTDAIVPSWSYMLIGLKLKAKAKIVLMGDLVNLEIGIWDNTLNNIDFSLFKNKRVIVKGCSEYDIPTAVYMSLAMRLESQALSVMFGEACSTVPVFKRNKK